MPHELGPRRRFPALDLVRDAIADEAKAKIEREKLTLADLRRMYGYSRRRTQEISAFLRGSPNARFEYMAALDLAERMQIPIRIDVAGRQVAA